MNHSVSGERKCSRELSLQLAERGWKSVLCFQTEPTEEVGRFLALPNVSVDMLTQQIALSKRGKVLPGSSAIIVRTSSTFISSALLILIRGLRASIRKTSILHRPPFTSVGLHCDARPLWKRTLGRIVNEPLTKVICVSNYGHVCMSSFGLLPAGSLSDDLQRRRQLAR